MNDWFPDSRTEQLYRRAQRDVWDPERVLDWDRCDLERISPRIRDAMANVYTDVLYAESCGIGVAGRLVELAGEGRSRDFGRLQVRDEERHVSLFAKIACKLGTGSEPPASLIELNREMAAVTHYDELLMYSQVVEVAAQMIVVENSRRSLALMDRGIRLPGSRALGEVLACIIQRVGRDESRHIAFGQRYLSRAFGCWSVSERRQLETRATRASQLMLGSFQARERDLRLLGAEPDALFDEIWEALRRQLGHFALDIGDRPGPASRLSSLPEPAG